MMHLVWMYVIKFKSTCSNYRNKDNHLQKFKDTKSNWLEYSTLAEKQGSQKRTRDTPSKRSFKFIENKSQAQPYLTCL